MSAEGTVLGSAAPADGNTPSGDVANANTDANSAAAGAAPGGQNAGQSQGAASDLTADQKAAAELLANAKTDEEKAAAQKAVDEAKAKAEADKKPAERVAPEKYEGFKLPEGYELDAELLEMATPVFKDLKMPQAEAQKLVDFWAKAQTKLYERQVQSWEKLTSSWLDTAKKDSEIGGEKFDETVSMAKNAVAKLGTPAFIEALNSTGAGNHPEFIRVFAKIGRYIADDKLHLGGTPAAKKSAADLIFNNTP